jgi:hypothetical protein
LEATAIGLCLRTMPLLTELGNYFHWILQRCRPGRGWAFALAGGHISKRWRDTGIVLDKAVSVGRKRQRTGAAQKLAHEPRAQTDAKRRGVRQSSAAFCRSVGGVGERTRPGCGSTRPASNSGSGKQSKGWDAFERLPFPADEASAGTRAARMLPSPSEAVATLGHSCGSGY